MSLEERYAADITTLDATPTSVSVEYRSSGVMLFAKLHEGRAVFTSPDAMKVNSILRKAMLAKALEAMQNAEHKQAAE